MNDSTNVPARLGLPGTFSLLGWAFSFYRSRLGLILGISVIPFILSGAQLLSGDIVSLVFGLAAGVVSYLSGLALLSAIITEEKQTVGGAYKKATNLLFSLVWISTLTGLTVLGGFFLFLIPGLLLMFWLIFPAYILVAENRRGMSALVQSWRYVKGYWLSVFWRFLVAGLILFVLFFIIGFVIGFVTVLSEWPLIDIFILPFQYFLATPLIIIYTYGIYRALKQIKEKEPVLTEADERKTRRNILIFLIIGIVGLMAIIAFAFFMFAALLQGIIGQPGTLY